LGGVKTEKMKKICVLGDAE